MSEDASKGFELFEVTNTKTYEEKQENKGEDEKGKFQGEEKQRVVTMDERGEQKKICINDNETQNTEK